jgi:hypothetical protein
VALPGGATLPGAGLSGGAEPQPPADQGSDGQADRPGRREAGLGGQRAGGQAGGDHQWCPPGQTAGPGGQLGGAAAPVPGEGGAAGVAQAASGWERRLGFGWHRLGSRRRPKNPEGVGRSIQGGPAAAQPLDGPVGVGVEELLELLGGQGTD